MSIHFKFMIRSANFILDGIFEKWWIFPNKRYLVIFILPWGPSIYHVRKITRKADLDNGQFGRCSVLYLCASKKIQNHAHVIYGCPLAGRQAHLKIAKFIFRCIHLNSLAIFFSWGSLSRERLTCARAYLQTTVCQKASSIEILSFLIKPNNFKKQCSLQLCH